MRIAIKLTHSVSLVSFLFATVIAAIAVVPVAAQPATEPRRCEVTIARAPDDVRKVIEAWVRAEPRCATTLEVRVVPTDGGLYLLARRADGRVHERVVPDAQSAGVLVASWVADDSVDPPAIRPEAGPEPTPRPAPPPARAPRAPSPAPTARAPSPAPAARAPSPARRADAIAPELDPDADETPAPALAPEVTPAPDETPAPALAPEVTPAPDAGPALAPPALAPPARRVGAPVALVAPAPAPLLVSERWLALGGMVALHDNAHGLRGELDLKTRGRWTLGLVFAWSRSDTPVFGPFESGDMRTSDLRALAALTRTTTRGRWSLRLQGGLGVMRTAVQGFFDGSELSSSGTFPTAEASALLSRRLFQRWALTAGPVLTVYSQRYDVMIGGLTDAQRNAELTMFGGLRHRL